MRRYCPRSRNEIEVSRAESPDSLVAAALEADVAGSAESRTEMLEVDAGSDSLVVTPGHALWVSSLGWQVAWHLEAGNRLQSLDGALPVSQVGSGGPHRGLEPGGRRLFHVLRRAASESALNRAAADGTTTIRDPTTKAAKYPNSAKKTPKNGLVTEYCKDNSVCSIGRNSDGKKTGSWKAFDVSGKLTKTTNHKTSSYVPVQSLSIGKPSCALSLIQYNTIARPGPPWQSRILSGANRK